MIGDTHFLALIKGGLEDLGNNDLFSSSTARQSLPYLLNQYEVVISQCHYSWAFTTQIKGGLAHLLSTKWKLPNYIYIMFGNEQVKECDILGDEIYKVLENLFTFVNQAIIDRKIKLPRKAKRINPPGIVIVKTVPKAEGLMDVANFKNCRRTFNRALQKTAYNFNWRSINIDAIVPSITPNFRDDGEELSRLGSKLLWKFLSDDIKTTDYSNNQKPAAWRITSPNNR